MIKKILGTVCALFLLAGCASSNGEATTATATSVSASSNSVSSASVSDDEATEGYGIHHAEITVKDYGVISLELDGDTAPATVKNFVELAESGFYDGLTFHRIMDGFMIQGGDPLGNGFGGSSKTIVGEFASNGHENNIKHVAGVISMARSGNPNSASSQFFIMVGAAPHLDGDYAAFGHVMEGLDIVKQIAKDARPIDDNGTIEAKDQPVIESIVVLD